jgi:hypothetical protein
MSDVQSVPTVISNPALEMIMRDVIDSMCELSLESGFQPTDGCFEIIDIYPANRESKESRTKHHPKSAQMEHSEIIEFPDLRRAAG